MTEIGKKGKVKVLRTREGNIFELVCAALLFILWIIVLWACINESAGAQTNTTNDDLTGIPLYIIIGLTGTFVSGLCLFSAYHPDTMASLPVKVQTEHGWLLVVRMLRVVALLTALLFIGVIIDAFLSFPIISLTFAGIIVATCVVFSVILAREK